MIGKKPVFIAGPCVIESEELLATVAAELVRINSAQSTDIIFKASPALGMVLGDRKAPRQGVAHQLPPPEAG